LHIVSSIHAIAFAGDIRQYVGQGDRTSTSDRPGAPSIWSWKACFIAAFVCLIRGTLLSAHRYT
jgi:hypothetical protein